MRLDLPSLPADSKIIRRGARRQYPSRTFAQFVHRHLSPIGEQLLGIERIRRMYRQMQDAVRPADLLRLSLERLGVEFDIESADERKIPGTGGVVLVANHPFGAIDGLFMISLVHRRRQDVRLLANAWLGELPAIADVMFPIDPLGGAAAVRANARSLRCALRWVDQGGALIVFPSGEVSHFQPRSRCVMDPDWSPAASGLIRKAGTPVIAVHFSGQNSAAFQLAGLLHERMRTALLAHEALNKRGLRVAVRVGEPVRPHRIAALADDGQLARYLRMRTYALADAVPCQTQRAAVEPPSPVAAEQPPGELEEELAGLGPLARLVTANGMSVYAASGARVPRLLQEVGRLREVTFRAAGEGTGRTVDVDLFDDYYEHLILWSHAQRRVVGAYRVARTDRIMARFGQRGLYTPTLFQFRRGFIQSLGPALELGRSFVRVEHQKEYGSLHLLWRGIGEYVRRDARYHRLFGAASISNDYCPASQALLVEFLRQRHADRRRARFVRGRSAVPCPPHLRPLIADLARCRDLDELSSLVADLEPDGKGIPVLIRQYLRLGGRILGFNRDPGFANAIDCLVLVDLRETAPKLLQRYVGAGGVAEIRAAGASANTDRLLSA
jgi:putative hemolysin